MQKATIFTTSDFFGNVQKHEVTLASAKKRPYAQYDNALELVFTPKGKRKPVRFIKTPKMYVLILAGHDYPDPESMYIEPKSEGGLTVSKSKYMSFDSRYKTDFDTHIESFISADKVLVDIRDTKSTDILSETVNK